MTKSIVLCFALSALSATALAAGCSDDNNSGTPSGKGESCTRTADCKGGLVCIDGTCSTAGTSRSDAGMSTSSGGGSGTAGSTGTGGATGTTTSNLGAEGESCTRHADCQTGLSCVLQACRSSTSTGTDMDGGTTKPLPTLGQRGESCQSVRDCAEGLSCFPRAGSSGGICDLKDYGLKPTGKTCTGECTDAKDCCELPPNVVIDDPVNSVFTSVTSCVEIVALLGGDAKVCDTTPSAANDAACFYYKTYCDCAATTWACTDNACVYGAKCSKDGNVFNGCPTRTRTGIGTGAGVCDIKAMKCQAGASGCTADADCETEAIFDDPAHTCAKDECTCNAGKCYRMCNEDLDCPAHYLCDSKTSVCTAQAACTTDTQCARTLADVRGACMGGKCVLPCTSDHDCSPSGASLGGGAFNAQVCGSDGVCVALGCASDDECQTAGNVKQFCVDTKTAPAGAVRSAITD